MKGVKDNIPIIGGIKGPKDDMKPGKGDKDDKKDDKKPDIGR